MQGLGLEGFGLGLGFRVLGLGFWGFGGIQTRAPNIVSLKGFRKTLPMPLSLPKSVLYEPQKQSCPP